MSLISLCNKLYDEMLSLEPYGADAPKTIIRIPIKLRGNELHRFMGAESQHLKLFAGEISLVGFSMAEKYIRESFPEEIVAYGSLTLNYFRGSVYKQISMIDFATDTSNEERGEHCGR